MGNSDNLGNTDCLRDSELTGDCFQLLQGKPGLCRVPNLELQTIPLYLESNFKWSSNGSGFVLLVLIAPGLLDRWQDVFPIALDRVGSPSHHFSLSDLYLLPLDMRMAIPSPRRFASVLLYSGLESLCLQL